MNAKFYDPNFDYLKFKVEIILVLKELEDKINEDKSNYYLSLKNEIEEVLNYVNQIIVQYYLV